MTTAVLEKPVVVDTMKPHRHLSVQGRVRSGKLRLNGRPLVEILVGAACVIVVVEDTEGNEVEHYPHPRLPLHKDVEKQKLDGFWGMGDKIVRQGPHNYNVSRKQGGADPLTVLAVAMQQGFMLPALESGGFDVELYINSAGEVQATLSIMKGSIWEGQGKKEIENPISPIFGVVELPAPVAEKAIAAGKETAATPLWKAPQLKLFDLPEPPKSISRGSLKDRLKSLNGGKKAI